MALVPGTPFDDTLAGTVNADTLLGFVGNDTLFGSLSADQMDGGDGIDLVDYTLSLGAITANLTTGLGLGGDAAGDTFIAIENLTGSGFDDILIGDVGVNVLNGGAGNDLLTGGAGADVLIGGLEIGRAHV